MRAPALCLFLTVLLASCTAPPATPFVCPVSAPNGSPPPGEQPSDLYLGNGQLWTALWPEGRVLFYPGGPGEIHADGTLGMKFPWWRAVEGPLTITGHLLDTPATELRADIPDGYGETGFQASAVYFPGEGCWEITGRAGEASLTFVVEVVQLEAAP